MDQPRVTLQMTLELHLVELCVVKGAEFFRQASECADNPELRTNHAGNEAELRLLRQSGAGLGFTLHFDERISRCDKLGDQGEKAVHVTRHGDDVITNIKSS